MGIGAPGNGFIGNRYYIQTMEVELQRPLGDEGVAHPTKDRTSELAFPDQY